MLTLGFFGPPNGIPMAAPSPVMVASNLSNASFELDKQNHWSSVTFDSTNQSGLGSTTGSFRR
jgi:hypothetical protein